MGLRMASPFRHPKSGYFYFRRAIPSDLQPVYGSQREIKVSLGTRDPGVAKSRFAAKASQYDFEFETRRRAYQEGASQRVAAAVCTFLDERNERAKANWHKVQTWLNDPGATDMPVRKIALEDGADPGSIRRAVENAPLGGEPEPLCDDTIDALRGTIADGTAAGGWVQHFALRLAMFEDAAAFAASTADPVDRSAMTGAAAAITATMAMSGSNEPQTHTRHTMRRQMLEAMGSSRTLAGIETLNRLAAAGNMAPIDRLIREVGRTLGQSVMAGDALYQAIGQALYAEMIGRLAHEDHPTVLAIAPATSPPVVHHSTTAPAPHIAAAAAGKHSMRAVFDDWVKKTKPKAQTRMEWQTSLTLFEAIVGPVAIEDLTEDHIFAFQSVCRDLPPMRGKMCPHADLKELARTNTGARLSSASVNKRVTAIRTLRRHAGSKMRLTLAPVDPDSRVAPLALANGGNTRNPFRLEELNGILIHPITEELVAEKRASTFWLLLMGTFTGARLGEMLQMSIHDVFETEGVMCIAVVTEEDDDAKSVGAIGRDTKEKAEKSVKNDNAKREIPIHPELLAAGFRDFVRGRKQRGYDDLFEDIPLVMGRRTNKGSLLVNNHVRAAGLSDPSKVFHSLRHSFRQRLESRIQKAMLNYLMGHSPGSVGERYAHGGLVVERWKAISQLDYCDLDLEQIRRIARSHIL